MTASLSANHSPAIVSYCTDPLPALEPQGHVVGDNWALDRLLGGSQSAGLPGDEFSTPVDHPLRTRLSNTSSDYWTELACCTVDREFIRVLLETSTQAALKLTGNLTQRLWLPAIDFRGAAWCRNDNTTSLPKRVAITMSKAPAENSTPSVAS